MPRPQCVFFALFLAATYPTLAQHVDASDASAPASLGVAWRFHLGADPGFVRPFVPAEVLHA